jgi:hypothetical protein
MRLWHGGMTLSEGQGRSSSPALTRAANARQRAGVKASTGPAGSLESRIASAAGAPCVLMRTAATSTQLPFWVLWLLLRQAARERSIVGTAFPPLVRSGGFLGQARDEGA